MYFVGNEQLAKIRCETYRASARGAIVRVKSETPPGSDAL